MNRKALSVAVKHQVLHEAGYKCGNPVCRTILTLEIHHLERVADGGGDGPENLLALCPNCHALHHRGEIPLESLRAWKMLLLAINEAYDRRSVDLLLMLDAVGMVYVSGDGMLECASLIAGGLVERKVFNTGRPIPNYGVHLTDRGRALVGAWKQGNQVAAVGAPPPLESGASPT
jgi:hypothetical protein